MAYLNLSYEDLASVICLAASIAEADGNTADSEVEAIIGALTEQFNFTGREDLLKAYLSDGVNMNPNDAARRVAAFGPTEKQWTSNFLVKTAVADGELADQEKDLYFKIQEICGLPDHNLSGPEEKEPEPEVNKIVGPESFEDLAAVIAVCLDTARSDDKFDQIEFKAILDGLRAQYNFEGRDDLLKQYIEFANNMDLNEAIERIKRFGPGPKQFTSDMLFMTIMSDENVSPEEEKVYKFMINECDLPLFTGADKL